MIDYLKYMFTSVDEWVDRGDTFVAAGYSVVSVMSLGNYLDGFITAYGTQFTGIIALTFLVLTLSLSCFISYWERDEQN